MKKTLSTCLLLSLLLAAFAMSLCSCKNSESFAAMNPAYAALYEEGDDEEAIRLKNLLIAQNESYNNGDPDGYFALFNMEKDDLNFNIASFRSLRQTCVLSYTLEGIHTAFVNEDNAQALLTMVAYAESKDSGEVLYHYRRRITYTLRKEKGNWVITEQSGEETLDDLTPETME